MLSSVMSWKRLNFLLRVAPSWVIGHNYHCFLSVWCHSQPHMITRIKHRTPPSQVDVYFIRHRKNISELQFFFVFSPPPFESAFSFSFFISCVSHCSMKNEMKTFALYFSWIQQGFNRISHSIRFNHIPEAVGNFKVMWRTWLTAYIKDILVFMSWIRCSKSCFIVLFNLIVYFATRGFAGCCTKNTLVFNVDIMVLTFTQSHSHLYFTSVKWSYMSCSSHVLSYSLCLPIENIKHVLCTLNDIFCWNDISLWSYIC